MPDERTVGRLLRTRAAAEGSRPFVFFGSRMVTYEQMEDRANRVASWFLSAGFRKGDKVAILLNNCLEWLYVWFGLAKTGVVSVPLNTHHKGSLLQYQVDHCDARLMVIGRDLVDRIRPFSGSLKNLTTLAVFPNDNGCSIPDLTTISFPELMKGAATPPDADIECGDDLMILYTTNSTGPSQGVVSPHGQYVRCGELRARLTGMTPDDVFYCVSPLYHIVPLGDIVMTSLIAGGAMVLTDRFSVRKFWWDVNRYNSTMTVIFGYLMKRLFEQPPRKDDADNRLRLALVPDAPVPIQEAFERRFDVLTTDAYGMTEADPIIACPVARRRLGSCGVAAEDLDVRVFDETDNELAPGEVGEIVCRPRRPSAMMKGYYKMPEETGDRWRGSWFHTGDLGYCDRDGYFYFTKAKNDGIKWRGENVSPYEVEQIVGTHPDVAESAVVRVPSEHGGDDAKLAVRLRQGKALAPERLLDFLDERMAFFMLPRYVEFADSFSRIGAGKVDKSRLRTVTSATWDREKAGYQLRRR